MQSFCVTQINFKFLAKIYEDGELVQDTTISKMETVVQRGFRGTILEKLDYYNLDAIIAVGYRVNSKRATQFRIWATKTLKEYLIKGYVLDDGRFKKGQSLTYFNELLDRIREIRTSEKLFYQQVKDIYALSLDYDKDDKKTVDFFKQVQNKFLWAVSEKAAAELVYYRANGNLPQMGLTSTEVEGIVKASDICVGKNSKAHRPMYMKDWIENLNIILKMNGRELLEGAGKISHELAKKKSRQEYKIYKERKKIEQQVQSIRELNEDLKDIK